jgi:NADH-quinone oxidoreductase subunit L
MVTAAAVPLPSLPGVLYLIPVAPLFAFALIGLVTRPWRRLSAAVAISAISISFLLAVGVLWSMVSSGDGVPRIAEFTWLATSTLNAVVGIRVDPLSAVMLVVVTTVALMVQVYSLGYMSGEEGLSRYYAYLSLFCASMLGLVLATNFLQLYICWELVGVCSYLLIGFWYDRHAPAFAAKKAFVTTRFGDLGFLVGLLMLCVSAGSFDFTAIEAKVASGAWSPAWMGTVAVLLFCGAAGKSAQVPLHVWLPDAMEGPTPVSALIHAATMVAAGVYMVARLFFLFSASPDAMTVVASIGGVTAIFAATIALGQDDIKRVLAYSTISQLGYMMLALGVGGMTAGMFHLFTHAFFKALLFLGAGSVIHATRTNNMWEMGGLRKSMPWTFWTFVIGSLALAGVAPFAGFFSKDAILHLVMGRNIPLFAFAAVGSLFTAFYMSRLIFVTFLGSPRTERHVHESPWVMRVPLVILAALSVTAGWWVEGFAKFVYFGEPDTVHLNLAFAAVTQALPLAGVLFAYMLYVRGKPDPDALARSFPAVCNIIRRRFYVDELYDWIIDNVVLRFSAVLAWFDRHAVDGSVNNVAWLTSWLGSTLRRVQTGRVQDYGMAVFGGVLALLGIAHLAGMF